MKDLIYKKTAITGAFLAAMLFFTSTIFPPAFAGSNIPVAVDIPVTYIVNGNDRTAGGDSLTLTADDPASPMPEGASGGSKVITMREEGNYSFGNMYYEKPGVHWYTITRDVTKKKGVVKDESVYRAKVIALNDGHGYVLAYKKGSDKKHEISYTDKTAPETGDTAGLMIYVAMVLCAAAALAVFVSTRIKNKGKDTSHELR